MRVKVIDKNFCLNFPLIFTALNATAIFRASPEDFRVEESLGFSFSGTGEHLCLQVEKIEDNTRWVAKLLASYFCVDESAVGYCGLKDRRAVAIQWFSIHLPGTFQTIEPKTITVDDTEFKVVASFRHNKKLRRGAHKENHFTIRLRDVAGDKVLLTSRLQRILNQGVPNYFGEQRFGHNGGNLIEADLLLRNEYGAQRIRGKKKVNSPRGGIYLSAARSYLFNLVLAERIKEYFSQSENETNSFILDSTGPMWGRGRSSESEETCRFEEKVLLGWQEWTNALEFTGMQQERRPLILVPSNFSWNWIPHENLVDIFDLELSFSLPPGAYATSVLREVLEVKKKSSPDEISMLATSSLI